MDTLPNPLVRAHDQEKLGFSASVLRSSRVGRTCFQKAARAADLFK
jgi:hypothetical protein